MNDEYFRLSLIDIMHAGLLNDFVNLIFDYNLKNDEEVYIQYKIASGNIILNILMFVPLGFMIPLLFKKCKRRK